MNIDLSTYAFADFVPFTADVYKATMRSYNQDWWPVQLFTLALGIFVYWVAFSFPREQRSRIVGLALGICWAWIGWAWYLNVYSDLNWAGTYFAGACFVQAALLIGMGLAGRLDATYGGKRREFGLEVAGFGIAAYAAWALLSGKAWADSLVFGHDPQATAVVTLGLVFLTARPAWPLMFVPIAICAVAGITAHVLGTFVGYVSAGVAVLVVAGGLLSLVVGSEPEADPP